MTASVTGSPRNASASVRSFWRIIARISGGAYSLSPAFTRTSPFGVLSTSYGTIFISSETSSYLRPMKRLMEKIVFCGFVTCWRFAGAPTSRWPSRVNATTDGGVRPPSAFGMTVGSPPSSTAIAELVVPRSIPIVFAIDTGSSVTGLLRKSKPLYSKSKRPPVSCLVFHGSSAETGLFAGLRPIRTCPESPGSEDHERREQDGSRLRKRRGAPKGASDRSGKRRVLHAVAHFLLRVVELVLAFAPLLLGLAFLLTHLVVGELAFLLLQLALDPVHFAGHADPLRRR